MPEFRVIVVCREKPGIGFQDQRLEFLPVGFPPPGDDCVSDRLAEHVARHPASNGWYIPKGCFCREGMEIVHVDRRRNRCRSPAPCT